MTPGTASIYSVHMTSPTDTAPRADYDRCPACCGGWTPEGFCAAGCEVDFSSRSDDRPMWSPLHRSGFRLPTDAEATAAMVGLSDAEVDALVGSLDALVRHCALGA